MRFLLNISLCITFCQSYAQVTKNQAIDFFGCKIVQTTLVPDERKKFDEYYPCNHNPDAKGIEKFLSDNHKDKTLGLFKEIQALRTAPEMNGPNDQYKAFLTEKVFQEKVKYKQISSYYDYHQKEPTFNAAITDIKNFLTVEASIDDSTGTEASVDAGHDTPTRSGEESKNEESKGFDVVTTEIDVIALSFAVLCSVILPLLIRSNRKGVSDEIREYVKSKIKELPFSSSRPSVDTFEKYEQLRKEIFDLKQEISLLKGKKPADRVPMEIVNVAQASPPLAEAPKPVTPEMEIFYLPTPNEDGSFPVNALSSTYREGASIYKMVRIGNHQANFEIYKHETSVRLALQYAELRIEPCCNALNGLTATTKNIVMKSPGVLELRGDKWYLVSKATISYEN